MCDEKLSSTKYLKKGGRIMIDPPHEKGKKNMSETFLF
jgi:hypothetical protein